MNVEMPAILNIVQGETLGQKMEHIATCMNTIAFMAKKLRGKLTKGTIIVDSGEYDKQRVVIDEQYGKWEDRFIAILQTGIGDWIRNTLLWNTFEKSGIEAHRELMTLIKEEHTKRELTELN